MNKRVELGSGLETAAFWMPFTANRQFKKAPRLLARAAGMHYWTADGRQLLDGQAGLWCVNAGHCRPKIVSHVSQYMTLLPGDIIATGTPPGVGLGMKPTPVFLKPGDVMTLTIEGLGQQKQKVVAYSAQ